MRELSLIEVFDRTAQKTPEKTAVSYEGKNMSFSSLRLQAITFSRQIRKAAGEERGPIAVFLDKSFEAVIADLAVLYADSFFMNLDPKNPDDRISAILTQVQPKVIITNEKYEDRVRKLASDIPIVLIRTEGITPETSIPDDWDEFHSGIVDTDPCCIINTSGSTGTPKSVVLNHRSFFDFMAWCFEVYDFSENEIMGCLSPTVFDIYVFELCMMMFKGATMLLVPDGIAAFPFKLLEYIRDYHATFLFWVPTIMVNIANQNLLSDIELPDLRKIWFAGEVFPTKQYNYWHHSLPAVQFSNLYGPIEITLDCIYLKIDSEYGDDQPLPIGYPCRNTDIILLNNNNESAGTDEEGEICVRGTSLAMGYYNDTEKTAAAFTQNPLNRAYPELIYRTGDIGVRGKDGLIYFKGRRDTLIKFDGYRIELTEIEHIAVDTLQIVDNGCALYDSGKKKILFVYEGAEDIAEGDFRKALAAKLPKYMIPRTFIRLDELPRNINGKIDRNMLKEKYAG